jgi:carbonic anhydrase
MQISAIAGAITLTLASAPLAASAKDEPNPQPARFCATQTSKDCQSAVTSQQVLEHFKQGNRRFASGHGTHRNYGQQVRETAKGQFPLASVVSCIDSRAPAEIVLDQGIGDIFNARIAGNIVNDDILGSLEFASKLSGSKLIVVMGHTSCGAVKGACDNVEMGNLTGLLARIQPAVAAVPTAAGVDRSSKNYQFVEDVSEANVRRNVQLIRERSPILREMEEKGEIMIVGAMYDVASGKVDWYD